MPLSITSAEAEDLARRLARMTGESVTDAITTAVRERIDRLTADDEQAVHARAERLLAIGADTAPRWAPHLRNVEHGDLLYDDRGLPR